MKKIVSIISATILGMALMFLSILVFTPTIHWRDQPEVSSMDSNEMFKGPQTTGKSDLGAAFPSSLLHAGLVAMLSFLIALSTCLIIRKKQLFP